MRALAVRVDAQRREQGGQRRGLLGLRAGQTADFLAARVLHGHVQGVPDPGRGHPVCDRQRRRAGHRPAQETRPQPQQSGGRGGAGAVDAQRVRDRVVAVRQARAAAQQGLQAVLPPELAAALALCLAVAGQHRLGVGRDGLAADVDAGQRRRERREHPERRAAAAGRAGAGQPEERAPAALGTLPGRKQPPPELRDLGPVQQLRRRARVETPSDELCVDLLEQREAGRDRREAHGRSRWRADVQARDVRGGRTAGGSVPVQVPGPAQVPGRVQPHHAVGARELDVQRAAHAARAAHHLDADDGWRRRGVPSERHHRALQLRVSARSRVDGNHQGARKTVRGIDLDRDLVQQRADCGQVRGLGDGGAACAARLLGHPLWTGQAGQQQPAAAREGLCHVRALLARHWQRRPRVHGDGGGGHAMHLCQE
mmetsp:Transcript_46143/g.109229  ORF Transcript_46143/g.109229 Transcript_46143/m.109229 type:complete len:427 (+) Transcript_46143:823-2103(+)